MSQVYLIEGPVGAGKSTFAEQLRQEKGCLVITLDDWMATLFKPDKPDDNIMEWYSGRKERCITQIWKIADSLLCSGNDIILELGLVQQKSRFDFYNRIKTSGHSVTIYVLDVPRNIRRERVRLRNQEKGSTYSMDVPDAIFTLASDMWQPPEYAEIEEYDIKFVPFDLA